MRAQTGSQSDWLRTYSYARAGFSTAWVAAAILAASNPVAVSVLLVIYPAWDALANLIDGRRSGGLLANRSQALNVVASTIMTIVVVVALTRDMHAVLAAFGVWAVLSGGLQLATGVRRWQSQGGQWAMILSGAQSVLAGGFMIARSTGTAPPSILDIAPYAAFGAFYFLVAAIWLAVSARRDAHSNA